MEKIVERLMGQLNLPYQDEETLRIAFAEAAEAEREACAQILEGEVLLPIAHWMGTKKEFGEHLCREVARLIRNRSEEEKH